MVSRKLVSAKNIELEDSWSLSKFSNFSDKMPSVCVFCEHLRWSFIQKQLTVFRQFYIYHETNVYHIEKLY